MSFHFPKEMFNIFHLRIIQFFDSEQYVGAGTPISDGLVPSIFCRKMEKTRPMREEMGGKVV